MNKTTYEIGDKIQGCDKFLLEINKNEFVKEKPSKWKYYYNIIIFNLGIIITSFGILSVFFPILYISMHDMIRMRPGSPTYELWSNPQPEVLVKLYIYNMTNSNEFLNGVASKIKLNEIGPITYREIIKYTNIIRNFKNSTLSYTVERKLEFVPELNVPDILNQTIIVPNTALLLMASYLQDYFFLIKSVFDRISKKDEVFLNTTIYNFLWNITTPSLKMLQKYVPNKVMNSGILFNIYDDPIDHVNVNIGEIHGFHNFFKINTVNYRPFSLGYYPENGDCTATIANSTEGSLFSNYLKKNSRVSTYRKTSCRPFTFLYKETNKINFILGYKYDVSLESFDRKYNLTEDCYKGYYEKNIYPNGIYDASKCYKDLPIVLSLPHFYGRHGQWNEQYEGFLPSKEKHLSTMIIEPMLGVPLQQKIRLQSNFMLPTLTGFRSHILKFSNFIVPQCWFEYSMENPTLLVTILVFFTATILPVGQYIISILLIGGGIILITLSVLNLKLYNSLQQIWLTKCIFKIKRNVIL